MSEGAMGIPALPATGQTRRLHRLDRAVLAVNRALMIIALAGMAVLIFANVLLRYLAHDGLVWAEEVSRYLMLWMTFLGIGPVLRLGGHMAVDTLQQKLSPGGARAVRGIIVALLAAFMAYFIYLGVIYAGRTWVQATAITEIPFSFVAGAVPVGFALALWHLCAIACGFIAEGRLETSADLDPEQAASL
ncbi:TRAP transporter small permease [Xanthobacter sp. VNH20]|uniref:TRAP transporter small permease n=1 Tax=Xanthobacter sp. VNH20 TaxID=3156616 RepID=UPI0032B32980